MSIYGVILRVLSVMQCYQRKLIKSAIATFLVTFFCFKQNKFFFEKKTNSSWKRSIDKVLIRVIASVIWEKPLEI